jgi:hypothetical protein
VQKSPRHEKETLARPWDSGIQKGKMSSDTSQKYWNAVLAKEGLSVWSGSDHHLVYLNRPPDHEQSGAYEQSNDEENRPARRHVKMGGAGDSQTSMLLQLALNVLSKKDQTFLEHYQNETVSEVATCYEITTHAVYCRIARIRLKLSNTALQLDSR